MAKDTSESGFIDLGKEYDPAVAMTVKEKPSKRVDYPTLFITHDIGDDEGLDDLPEEGEAVIRYKLRSYKEDLKNKTCSCELDIVSIKPSATREKKRKTSEDSLGEALDEIANKKK